MKKVWKYRPDEAEDFASEGFSVEVANGYNSATIRISEDWGYTDELYSDGVQVRIPFWAAAEVAEFISSCISTATTPRS